MARVNNLSDFLTDVASAIKTKKGSETAIPAANFDTEILALPAQGTYQQKSVTISANGTTTLGPDQGYDAMDEVSIEVNVPTGGEDLENVIAEQENIIANLSNIVNTKAGTLYPVPDGTKFTGSTFSTIPNLDTSNMTNMSDMFRGCYNLTSVPNFNTSNVTSMTSMFRSCSRLTSVPEFDTSHVTDMEAMFSQCYNLTSVPEFDITNVTDTHDMFNNCRNLISAPNFNTFNVFNMHGMFSGCSNLISVPEFDTSHTNEIGMMFQQCNNLSDASIQNIINMCLNSNITTARFKNLSNVNSHSPFLGTNITNSRYSNRLEELTAAGWKY